MTTITVRNVPEKLLRELKKLAKEQHRSMEQEVHAIIQKRIEERAEERQRHEKRMALLREIEESWSRQKRRPTAEEVQSWIREGREHRR